MTDKLPPEVAEALRRLATPFDPFISDSPLSSGGSLHDTRVCASALRRIAEENARLKATVEAWNQWVKDGMRVALPPLKLEDGERE